ncbi:MAG: FAD-dependent oxidoreductase [Bdellovibrionales bacterium]
MKVAIIGSGIAGACVASALQRYGASVTVFERGSTIAHEASGNPAALVMPRLDLGETPIAHLHRAAFIYAVGFYEALDAFTTQGVWDSSYDADKQQRLMADPPLPADWLSEHSGRLFHERGGVIDPRTTITSLLQGCGVRLNQNIETLPAGFGAAVICAGRLLGDFAALPLSYRAGQVDWATGAAAAQMAESYAVPMNDNIVFGATHDRWADPHTLPPVTAEASQHNKDNLKKLTGLDAADTNARTGIRAAVPDRLPLAGRWKDNVYVLGALGARGFTTAPLLGEMIASEILGLPCPLPLDVAVIIQPSRYAGYSLNPPVQTAHRQ